MHININIMYMQQLSKEVCTHCVVQEPAELHGVDVEAPQGSEAGLLLCCQSAGWPILPPRPSALQSRHTPFKTFGGGLVTAH